MEAKLQSSVDILAEKTKELDTNKATVADLERQLAAAEAEKRAALDQVENGAKELAGKIAALEKEKNAAEKLASELEEKVKSKEQAAADIMRQMNDVQRDLVDAKTNCVELKVWIAPFYYVCFFHFLYFWLFPFIRKMLYCLLDSMN